MVNIFRKGATFGLWLVFLMPLALLTSTLKEENFQSVKFGFLLTSIHAIYAMYFLFQISNQKSFFNLLRSTWLPKEEEKKLSQENFLVLTKWTLARLKFLGPISVLLFFILPLPSNIVAILNIAAFVVYLPIVFVTWPQSFSFGEGALALQAFLHFISSSLLSIVVDGSDNPGSLNGSFAFIAKVCCLSVIFVCVTFQTPFFNRTTSTTMFNLYGVVFLTVVTIPVLQYHLHRNVILWVLEYMISSYQIIFMSMFWAVCVVVSILAVAQRSAGQCKATTVERKYFHGLVVMVFASGIIIDRFLLFLASSIVMAIMILLEYIRVMKIVPLGPILDSGFKFYRDEKDEGSLILSHIYLLVGASLPLWLVSDLSSANSITLLSGVLSIGIGDSAASIIGYRYGKIKFPGTSKSAEGTLASILSQIAFVSFVSWFVSDAKISTAIVLIIVLTSFIEALTTQVDNVVLPLIFYILSQMI